METWEYTTIKMYESDSRSAVEKRLANLGVQRWELCGIDIYNRYIFKHKTIT